MNRRHLLLSCAATALTLSSSLALAQDADKPIRLVVPYAPGGPLDITARALAERVQATLGTVIVDNKPGAGGNIGADFVAKAAPDGLTIGLAATATHAVNPWLYKRIPFDAAKDFAGITQMVRVPNVVVVNADKAERLKIKTVADLIAYAKAHPGQLNYGSGGNGSAGHLAGEMFKQRAGIYALHIPYRGANPAQLALLAGEVDFNIDTWWGLVAPADTPKAVIDKLNEAFTAALKAPETHTRFAALMAEPVPTTPAQFDALMAAERAKYEKVVKASGATVD